MPSLRVGLAVPLLLAAAPAARAVTIAHEGAGCVIAGRFPRFEARLDPAGEVARARVFFRAEGTPHWYSVDMTAGAAGFTGVLPKPRRTTPRIQYYVEASDRAFASARTPERVVQVVGSPGECETNALVAPVSATARVVVTAAPGAPAVPAGFLSAGLAGAGGVSAVTLAVVGGGAAAAAGVAVAAGSGGGAADPRPQPSATPPPTTVTVFPTPPPPPPTPPPTEDPVDAAIGGAWIGVGGDGLHRDVTRNFQPFDCHREDDLFLDLQQSGRTVTGSARFVSRAGTTCEPELGAERGFAVSGTVNGAHVRLTLSAPLPGGGRSTHDLNGDLAGTRIDGPAASAWDDAGQMGRARGTWSVQRQ
jgi:hypothetical protein